MAERCKQNALETGDCYIALCLNRLIKGYISFVFTLLNCWGSWCVTEEEQSRRQQPQPLKQVGWQTCYTTPLLSLSPNFQPHPLWFLLRVTEDTNDADVLQAVNIALHTLLLIYTVLLMLRKKILINMYRSQFLLQFPEPE